MFIFICWDIFFFILSGGDDKLVDFGFFVVLFKFFKFFKLGIGFLLFGGIMLDVDEIFDNSWVSWVWCFDGFCMEWLEFIILFWLFDFISLLGRVLIMLCMLSKLLKFIKRK